MDARAAEHGFATGPHADYGARRGSAVLGRAVEGHIEGGRVRVEGVGHVDAGCRLVCVVARVDYCGGGGSGELAVR